MTKDQLYARYRTWIKRIGGAAFEEDLSNAQLLLSYDDKRTETTFSAVSVYTVAAHTNSVHLFLFSERTTWQLDRRGDTGKTLSEKYKLILSF